jgi:PEP-CTERM motif
MRSVKRLLFLAIALMLLGTGITGNASASVTFAFNPNDLIQSYAPQAGDVNDPGSYKATQANARRLHEQWGGTWYETFYNPASPQPQPNSYNTYRNWADGLGAGEGISGFNIWLLDNPNARSWGEKTVWDPNGATPTGTADAAGQWNVSAIENPWGEGFLVEWWTDNPDYYINSTSTIGDFSFSGDAYWDNNENGFDASDELVQFGESARIWFGAVNYRDADGESNSVHFDNLGWGGASPADGPFNPFGGNGYGSGYEGVLDIDAVPEPGTVILLGLGLLGAAVVGRKKLRK